MHSSEETFSKQQTELALGILYEFLQLISLQNFYRTISTFRMKNDEEIERNEKNLKMVKVSDTVFRLEIEEFTEADQTDYTCTARNDAGAILTRGNVSIGGKTANISFQILLKIYRTSDVLCIRPQIYSSHGLF